MDSYSGYAGWNSGYAGWNSGYTGWNSGYTDTYPDSKYAKYARSPWYTW